MSVRLDFDSTQPNGGLQLVQDAFTLSKAYSNPRLDQYRRDYQLLNGFIDMARRDPSRAHVFIMKTWEIVRGKVPRDFKALFGYRPYIPFEARREDYKEIGAMISEMLDHYLVVHNFKVVGALATLIKTVYGTSYVEAIPYYERVNRTEWVNQMMGDQVVGRVAMKRAVDLLRFSIRTYAPWEIYHDPFATNLEEEGGCRYLIHYQIASKRAIRRLAENGAYPGFDVAALDKENGLMSGISSIDDRGREILNSVGLNTPLTDPDMCLLLRYQSDDRYIDVINGRVVLRDIPNPYGENAETGTCGHKKINVCRFVHLQDAHPMNQFEGIGEVKPNEINQSLLNDLASQRINAFNFIAQPGIVYDAEAFPDSMVWEFGGRYPYKSRTGERIDNLFKVLTGENLPEDHYRMTEDTERNMDLTSQRWSLQRGEPTSGQRTLGEAGMLREAGDEPQELNITLAEQIFFKSFGEKMLSHMNQFGTSMDANEILGPERASQVMTLDPQHLPGGYYFTLKGADRISNILVQQRAMVELTQPILECLNGGNFELAQILLEKHEIPQTDIDRIINEGKAKLMFQMQQAAMQAEQQAAMDAENADADHERELETIKAKNGAGPKKAKKNTPGKTYGDQNRIRSAVN